MYRSVKRPIIIIVFFVVFVPILVFAERRVIVKGISNLIFTGHDRRGLLDLKPLPAEKYVTGGAVPAAFKPYSNGVFEIKVPEGFFLNDMDKALAALYDWKKQGIDKVISVSYYRAGRFMESFAGGDKKKQWMLKRLHVDNNYDFVKSMLGATTDAGTVSGLMLCLLKEQWLGKLKRGTVKIYEYKNDTNRLKGFIVYDKTDKEQLFHAIVCDKKDDLFDVKMQIMGENDHLSLHEVYAVISTVKKL